MKHKVLFALVMGSITTAVVSFTLLSINKGFGNGFFYVWLQSWVISYVVAVPVILLIGPKVQSMIHTKREPAKRCRG